MNPRLPVTDPLKMHEVARDIARAAVGYDPGPMTPMPSGSHNVFLSPEIVVKIIDSGKHSRLEREIALVPHLPIGLTAPLLGSGLHHLENRDILFACYSRASGAAPGMGMPGVDAVTARLLAEQAVTRLAELHSWVPVSQCEQTLREPLDHGGFLNQAAFVADVERLGAADRHGTIPLNLLEGLMAIAQRAPMHARVVVPVHADCHWGNWLACDDRLTALLDFEWARFGEPVDDWFFLVRFSGPHIETVLDVVARATRTPPETLRAACELREASFLASDLRAILENSSVRTDTAPDRLRALETLIFDRNWGPRAR